MNPHECINRSAWIDAYLANAIAEGASLMGKRIRFVEMTSRHFDDG